MKTNTKEVKNNTKLTALDTLMQENRIDLVVSDFFNSDDDLPANFDKLVEDLEDNSALDVDIIYYHNAIEYLKNNDCSLNESLELANEYGFTLEGLNSEILASLLATAKLREGFYSLESEINDILV